MKYVPLCCYNGQQDFASSFFCLWKIPATREGPGVPREHLSCAMGEPFVSSIWWERGCRKENRTKAFSGDFRGLVCVLWSRNTQRGEG